MSMLNSILGQMSGNVDVENMAAKLGIDPSTAAQAITALGIAHPQPGDTVTTASAATGLDSSLLNQIVGHIGGEGSLGEFSRMLQDHPEGAGVMGMLDKDGDGNPLNDLMGMAKSFFGKT
jgi:hypothetical protein